MWKWLGNALGTLTEADSTRLRRLDAQVQDLADDVALLLGQVPKINARLRQKARREMEGDEREVIEPPPPDTRPVLVPEVATYTKDQLRAMGRAKGIRA